MRAVYREYPAPCDLASYVECFWSYETLQGATGPVLLRKVLPDGRIDIGFHLHGKTTELRADGGLGSSPVSRIFGMLTRPKAILVQDQVRSVGVRFKPGQAGRFIETPLEHLTDQLPSISDVFGRFGSELEDRLLSGPLDTRASIELLASEIRKKLLCGNRAVNPIVRVALAKIEGSRGLLPIHALESELGVTRQYLARLFRQYVGVSPKVFSRITRFNSLLVSLSSAPDWCDVALNAGYCDQSHLIAEFTEFAGESPVSYRAANE